MSVTKSLNTPATGRPSGRQRGLKPALRLLSVSLLLVACAPKSSPARFYGLAPETGLQSLAESAAMETTGPRRVIGLGPVRIPGYLDRPQIVTGATGNRLDLDEYHRWAEPLRDTLGRVLSENLAARLPKDHLLTFPWNRALTPDYQIEIDIARFHVNAEGVAELWATWSVLQRNQPVLLKKSRIAQPVRGNDTDARITAQNLVLGRFGRELAEALTALPKN
jgi:uncharacterized lipoprotein YmbA